MINNTLEETKAFNSTKELNKQYKELREMIIVRHGYKSGDKVRLKNAIRMMVSYDGTTFLNCGTVLSDMKDRVKMNEITKGKGIYKLVALV